MLQPEERLAARTPELLLEVVEELTTKQFGIHIHNHGGAAIRVRFAVALGNSLAYGDPARLRPSSPVKVGVIETNVVTPGGVAAPGFVAGMEHGRHASVRPLDGR